jgi:imidazolonepropionase-like amidohydrolase
VARLSREGVDHIKMRTTPDLETLLAVGDEAKRQGLPFAAHALAAPEELLAAKLSSVEHFFAFHHWAEHAKNAAPCFRRSRAPACLCPTRA